jgi:hypothetical protein
MATVIKAMALQTGLIRSYSPTSVMMCVEISLAQATGR